MDMNSKRRFIILLLLPLLLFISACQTSEEVSKEEVTFDLSLVEKGEKQVKTSCLVCHGADLNGEMGPSLHHLTHTKEELIEILIKGQGSMMPRTANGNEEAVAEYLLWLNQ